MKKLLVLMMLALAAGLCWPVGAEDRKEDGSTKPVGKPTPAARAAKPVPIETILQDLKDKDRVVRRDAAEALGRLGGVRAVEPLIACLKDKDPEVRGFAALALGALRDARAVAPLIACLKDADWYARRQAAKALGQLGDTRAVEPLVACLEDKNSYVGAAAAVGLAQLGDLRATKPLIAFLKDEDHDVRDSTQYILGDVRDLRAATALSACLKDAALDTDIHYLAEETLKKLKPMAVESPQPPNARLHAGPQMWQEEPQLDSSLSQTTPESGPDSFQSIGYVLEYLELRGDWRPLQVCLEYPQFIHPDASVEKRLNEHIQRTVRDAGTSVYCFEIYTYRERFISLRYFTHTEGKFVLDRPRSYTVNLRLGTPFTALELKDFFMPDSAYTDVLRELVLEPLKERVANQREGCPRSAEELADDLWEFDVFSTGLYFNWLFYQVGPWEFGVKVPFGKLEKVLNYKTLAELGLATGPPTEASGLHPAESSASKESAPIEQAAKPVQDSKPATDEKTSLTLKQAELDPFIEKGTRLLTQASADLNGDGTMDHILVLEKQKEKTEDPDIEKGQRPLLIVLRDPNGTLKVVKRNDKIIRAPDWKDPLQPLETGLKTFTVGRSVTSLGNRGGSTEWATYKFNYSRIDQTWQLVRVEEGESSSLDDTEYGESSENRKPKVYTPPKDYGKIDIADFDPNEYLGKGER